MPVVTVKKTAAAINDYLESADGISFPAVLYSTDFSDESVNNFYSIYHSAHDIVGIGICTLLLRLTVTQRRKVFKSITHS